MVGRIIAAILNVPLEHTDVFTYSISEVLERVCFLTVKYTATMGKRKRREIEKNDNKPKLKLLFLSNEGVVMKLLKYAAPDDNKVIKFQTNQEFRKRYPVAGKCYAEPVAIFKTRC